MSTGSTPSIYRPTLVSSSPPLPPKRSTTGNRTPRRLGAFSLPAALATPVPARLQDAAFRGRARPALEAALSRDYCAHEQGKILMGEGRGNFPIVGRRNTLPRHTSPPSFLHPHLKSRLARPSFHQTQSSSLLSSSQSPKTQSPPFLQSHLISPPRSSSAATIACTSTSLFLSSSSSSSTPVPIERTDTPPSPGILLQASPASPTNFTPTKIVVRDNARISPAVAPSSSSLLIERPSATTSRILILPLTPSPTVISPLSPQDLRDSYFPDPPPASTSPPRKAKPSPALSVALPPPTLVGIGSAAWMEGHLDTPIVEVDQEEIILCALEERSSGLGLDLAGMRVAVGEEENSVGRGREEGTGTTAPGTRVEGRESESGSEAEIEG